MNNFEYCCPTHVVFGKGSIAKLNDLIDKNKKVLMIYGGGSIMKNGVYNQVKQALEGYNLLEFGGIEPNPKYETCMKAVEIIKNEGVDFLLSVGGGSTLDATKFISIASKYNGNDAYDAIMIREEQINDAIPLGDVITLPATGSEMNNGGVISRLSTGEKLPFHNNLVYPQFSIIDPEVTFSLPVRQTINGIVDTFVHVMEQYSTYDVNTPLQDGWALTILKTLIDEAPKVLSNPADYDARANIFWCATCGLNYWISLGAVQDWATHMIGHELTAFYGIDHGQSLAIVLPRLLKNQKVSKSRKLAKLAREVFGINEPVDLKAADIAIERIEEFFNSIGMKTKLSDYEIDSQEAAEKIRARFEQRNVAFGEKGAVTADTAYDILTEC
ncbi:TPA: iron-containing alcohol dehydrogenase [Candidatus Scatousia excrementigallinarum]|uniref:Iron-containing alcohol dehydrogenase n=1 Tax=Candidatus Scatousia excrementigallinarum TaxID=2840935 RepID=A0A9D1JMN3_9BACT|nr:iron-containing alcohol dehydrogenase [Candidatus Scatousia excrementigallinarum]